MRNIWRITTCKGPIKTPIWIGRDDLDVQARSALMAISKATPKLKRGERILAVEHLCWIDIK